MALAAGSLAYLDYGEHPRCVHVRLILGHVTGNEYVVLAPGHDVYSEVLDVVRTRTLPTVGWGLETERSLLVSLDGRCTDLRC